MHPRLALAVLALSVSLTGCGPQPPAPADDQARETADAPLVALPAPPSDLTAAGRALIYEFETGGEVQYRRSPYPEAPDAKLSGITEGIGYDNHQNAAAVILADWRAGLGAHNAQRLAATHPFYGVTAQAHLHEVKDVLVSWEAATVVFNQVDVARTTAACRRAFPGFDALKPNARAAMISLAFNRGTATVGDRYREMRHLKEEDIPNEDYRGMARQFRLMERIWHGTALERGMTRRREAEARLVESCL